MVRKRSGKSGIRTFVTFALAAAFLSSTLASSAFAQSYRVETRSSEGVRLQDIKNNASPGNFHLFLVPVFAYLGRATAFGAGAEFDWELGNNFAIRGSGYYPYYMFDRDDRRETFWRTEGGFRVHFSRDQTSNDRIDVSGSSSSARVGDYIVTQSYSKWVNRNAIHRITHGLNAGLIAQRSPTEFELAGGNTAYPLATELTIYAGYAYTDSTERSVYVEGYGTRGNAYFQMVYVDLLVAATRFYGDFEPEEEPGRIGFRGGLQAAYGEDFGYGTRVEIGLNPGRAQGWYGMITFSAALNVWLGPRN
jgi:hypothetical protein